LDAAVGNGKNHPTALLELAAAQTLF